MLFEQITMLQINYFMAVARHLNFSKASKSLYVSQPSLSRQVSMLEHQVGVQLFYRTPKGVELTPAGKILYEDLSKLQQQLKMTFEKVRSSTLCNGSEIRIGCLEAMDTDLFLPQMINNFKNRYPQVDIILERHSFKVLREALIKGTLDVIFTLSFEAEDNPALSSKTVFETCLSVFMSCSHPMAELNELKIRDLRDENFVMVQRDECPRGADQFIEICRQNGFSPKIIRQVPNPESLLLCVKSGLAISMLDATIYLRNKDAYKIFHFPDYPVEIIMAWKHGDQLKAKQFLEDLCLPISPPE